ncbi:MAG: DUF2721 domain-containing protein [Leptospira sp.]|nr:DUF2721 domain-containing protein [Leptospira sp.]
MFTDSFNLSTPALLFPAVSLLMLAYTNRFVALSHLIRSLHSEYKTQPDSKILGQIANLRLRLFLIRAMQFAGVFSLFLCVFCMLLLTLDETAIAKGIFVASLVFLLVSLGLSLWEIQISTNALNVNLSDLDDDGKSGK